MFPFALMATKLALTALATVSPVGTTTSVAPVTYERDYVPTVTQLIPPATADVTIAEDDPAWQCHVMGDNRCATVPQDAPFIWQEECYLLIQGTAAGVGFLPLHLPVEYWNACIDAGAQL